jgi:hypothetical protein
MRVCRPLAASLLSLLLLAPASAQERIAIFDAHMHYNWEPTPYLPPAQLVEFFRRNDVVGVLSNSRPNTGTHALMELKPQGFWVVPFIRPYRTRADIQTWFKDSAIWELVQSEYKRGYYRGIGEFHIYGKDAQAEVAVKVVRFANERDLYLLAHCDVEALEILLSHDPRAKLIWAHTGFSTPPEKIKELFARFPRLVGELSFRSGITDAAGKLTPEWRELFARHADRFLLGSDTWIAPRWMQYEAIMSEYRGWLAQLPREQALKIAHDNAERLFGPRKVD